MAFDSEGNFIRIHNWEQDRLNDIGIVSDRHDEEDNNFAAAFNECFLRNGRVPLGGELKMNGHQIKNIGNATTATDAINKGPVESAIEVLQATLKEILVLNLGLGDIKASVRTENHGNWLLCDGQAISRTDYAELFTLIGTTYGAGDGVTTFNVPDFSDVILPTATTVDVKGTGKTLGLTNGTDVAGLIGDSSSYNHHIFRKAAIDKDISTSLSGTSDGPIDGLIGVATDAAKSGLTGDIVSTIQMNYFIKAKEEA